MINIYRRLYALYHPEQFHGWGNKKLFFEGWYYKVVSASEHEALAIIPGIAINAKDKRHAFIQVLDGKAGLSRYLKFDTKEFVPDPKKFSLTIGKNRFTKDHIYLDLDDIKGELRFHGQVGWPVSPLSPGIMGPYAFAPFMECYHGIVSMDHQIDGRLKVSNQDVDFSGGRGYIEKDWGKSFPSAYVWMQSNHFESPGISLKLSVANIPWLRSSFTGFIAGFWLHNRLYRFTTYNSTKLTQCKIDIDKVSVQLENRNFVLNVEALRTASTELASPIFGLMEGRINESMTSEIMVRLFNKRAKKTIFEGKGRSAGLEVAGQIEQIMI